MWTVVMGSKALKNFDRVSDGGKSNWNQFRRSIVVGQNHPRAAAVEVGSVGGSRNMGYKCLSEKLQQFQVRLDNSNRASFTVLEHDEGGVVSVIDVGGHT